MLVVVFFLLTVTLFPLGIGPETAVLQRIAPGVIWVAALLAAMLSLDRLFQVDYEDGSLDQLALAPLPLELVAAAKCIAHWLSTGLPLLVISPLLGVLLNLSKDAYSTLLLAMAIGTPSLSLVGGVGAALTVGIRRGGGLAVAAGPAALHPHPDIRGGRNRRGAGRAGRERPSSGARSRSRRRSAACTMGDRRCLAFEPRMTERLRGNTANLEML